MDFKDKVVLITGGSSGIGLSAAIKFAQAGAKVAILSRNEKKLENAVAEIMKLAPNNKNVISISCDTRDEKGVISAFKRIIESFGRLDIIVNNAGTARSAKVEDTSLDLWREMLDIHCTGYFLVAREAVRIFIDQGDGGVMVFVASDNAIRPSKDFVAYNTAKAGVLHMARSIAEECGHYGIRVNSILPGSTFGRSSLWTTEFVEERAKTHGFNPKQIEDEYKKNTALGVVIDSDEVADVILFLASNKSLKMTGAVLSIDGGGKGGYVR